jgi:hypothetical protein
MTSTNSSVKTTVTGRSLPRDLLTTGSGSDSSASASRVRVTTKAFGSGYRVSSKLLPRRPQVATPLGADSSQGGSNLLSMCSRLGSRNYAYSWVSRAYG